MLVIFDRKHQNLVLANKKIAGISGQYLPTERRETTKKDITNHTNCPIVHLKTVAKIKNIQDTVLLREKV